MTLTNKAIEAISNTKTRAYLGIELNLSASRMYAIIDENKDNGPLTTAGALSVIREQTGLSDDEILVSEKSMA